jgi:hypothetical protein
MLETEVSETTNFDCECIKLFALEDSVSWSSDPKAVTPTINASRKHLPGYWTNGFGPVVGG